MQKNAHLANKIVGIVEIFTVIWMKRVDILFGSKRMIADNVVNLSSRTLSTEVFLREMRYRVALRSG